ncbi:unnamed protein product [Effrenium voratum]|uniref:HIT-type domain-containing protein n=1 Tax=Effrenium voratum TaxID=2562239 RepID=A0AA36HSE8_9DINO|nr:unnamed protein product [Effrenium voratum]
MDMSAEAKEIASPDEGVGMPAPRLCEVCREKAVCYRCPACELRSCSAACVKVHKVQSGCTGKRPRTEQVAPLNAFTDNVLLRDFGLLEEVDAAVDRAERDLRIREEEMRLYQPRRHKQRIHLARACASAERQTRLILAPFAMTIARENTSRVVDGGKGRRKGKGKGKGKKGEQEKPAYIAWRVDWHFGHCGQVLTDKNLPEHEVVGRVLERFLNNSYVEHGADKLEVFLHQPRVKEPELPGQAESEEEPEAGSTVSLPMCPPPCGQREVDTLSSAPWRLQPQAESESESESESEQSPGAQGQQQQPFVRLDKLRTLRENLMDRVVREFPVLHVALPQELSRFEAG